MNVDDRHPSPHTDGPPEQGRRAESPGLPDLVAWHAGGTPEGDPPDEGRPPLTPEQLDAALERWR